MPEKELDQGRVKSNLLEWLRLNQNRFKRVGSILLFLVIWELVARFGKLSMNLFPPASWVYREMVGMIQSGMWFADVWASLKRALSGLMVGSGLGIIIGLLTGRVLPIRTLLEPVIQLLRPIPSIAWVSMAIFWFGLGETAKLFLISYGVFFPVWLNTHVGVTTVDPVLVRAARSLGAEGRHLFVEVILPAAVPFIMAGFRNGVAVAFIVLVAAELTGANAGVGFRITASHVIYRADRMMVGLVTLGILGGTSDLIISNLSRRLIFWTGEGRSQ
jgi:NitT/TauT family transport system permease protein|tara:strand:- start:1791 stop:2612 length:822 start_codon:yes stop_codon:yes gene_type:complete